MINGENFLYYYKLYNKTDEIFDKNIKRIKEKLFIKEFNCYVISKKNFIVRKEIDFSLIDEKVVFFHKTKNKFFSIDHVPSIIFLLCYYDFEEVDICNFLSVYFNIDNDVIRNDFTGFLIDLKKKDILK